MVAATAVVREEVATEEGWVAVATEVVMEEAVRVAARAVVARAAAMEGVEMAVG